MTELFGDITIRLQGPRPDTSWSHLVHGSSGVGRHPASIVRVSASQVWMPQVLVRLRAVSGEGWIVQAGTGVTVEVLGRLVRAQVAPSGNHLLGAGAWDLRFPTLDHGCTLHVRIYRAGRSSAPPLPHDPHRRPQISIDELDGVRVSPKQTVGEGLLTDLAELHRLAVLFEHVLLDLPEPGNLFQAAADRLGLPEAELRSWTNGVRRKLNRRRSNEIETAAQLGDYLVHTAGVLAPEHLDEPPPAPPSRS